jgi:sigma-B regulation protein RsbU (phosphoserine phosphatase)
LLPAADYKGRGFDVASASLPCRAIGGDFLDCFDLAGGMFGFVVGDVAGKGPPAALLAARMQGILAASTNALSAPSHTVTLINRELGRRSVEAHFATLLYGVLSSDGSLTYCNAGHNPGLLVGRRGVRTLTAGGVPLGVFPDAVFEQETLQLDPDDMLVVFTDGVVEALNSEGQEFGDDRLLELLHVDRSLPPAALLDRVMTAVREFTANVEQHDDITALILRYEHVAAAVVK